MVGFKRFFIPEKWRFLCFSGGGRYFPGADLFACRSCHHLWELSEPGNAWRGYFQPIELQPGAKSFIPPTS
jgi:hypothetical protein